MGTILRLSNADFSANRVSIVKEVTWYTQQSYEKTGTAYSDPGKYETLALNNINMQADVIGKAVNAAKIRVLKTGNITVYKISSGVATELITKQVTADDVAKGYVLITWDEQIVFSTDNYICFSPSDILLYNLSMTPDGYGMASYDPSTSTYGESTSTAYTLFIDFGLVSNG